MDWVLLGVKEEGSFPPLQQPYFGYEPPPAAAANDFGLNSNKVSPSLLLTIVILAIIFFVSGLLHLLVRFLWRPTSRDADDLESVTALQGQLQQLFHLHDAGVDQSFIDTLPVFHYKAIIGLKNPFDCAVCLCEFEAEDKLRLLPKCSHAFHMECIDTWLLSHSTCPLCRGSLLSDFSPGNARSPIVLVLESGSESSREIVADREPTAERTSSHLGSDPCAKPRDGGAAAADSEERVVPVRLGKFRNVDVVGESSTNNSADARRCFSMGSFEYVMDENCSLQVPVRTMKKQPRKKPSLPLTPGYRPAMSEYDCESWRDFSGLEPHGSAMGRTKKESFSASKSWLRGKDKPLSAADSSRRAFSFRFPANRPTDDAKVKDEAGGARRTKSEIGIQRWENGGTGPGRDDESQGRSSFDSLGNAPSFARKTLIWLAGRQNKVVHSPFSSNV